MVVHDVCCHQGSALAHPHFLAFVAVVPERVLRETILATRCHVRRWMLREGESIDESDKNALQPRLH